MRNGQRDALTIAARTNEHCPPFKGLRARTEGGQDAQGDCVWNVTLHRVLSLQMTFVVAPTHPLERQMSKHKRGTGSKQPPGPRIARVHRATQPVVRSPKDRPPRSVAADSAEPPPERRDDSQQEALLVENPPTASQTEPPPERHDDSKREAPLVSKQDSPLVESPPTAPQDDRDQTTSDNFPSATANVRTYQAKLLEMAQADMQLAFEFAERLAAIRSPVEFPRVIAEFTGKRITMFVDRSRQVAELSTRRKAT
jgi:Phasin protein